MSDDGGLAASRTPPPGAVAWCIRFSSPRTAAPLADVHASSSVTLPRAVLRRRMTQRERDALLRSRLGAQQKGNVHAACEHDGTSSRQRRCDGGVTDKTDEDGTQHGNDGAIDDDDDDDDVVPRHLTTTRSDLESRLVLPLSRLVCVVKQYPRACGIAALTSVYNYLYSRLGESSAYASRAPVSQEEVMTVLGFAPPFDDGNGDGYAIPWGTFTGNATLMRWFHALNRHYGLRGHASILYKAHGADHTCAYSEDAVPSCAADGLGGGDGGNGGRHDVLTAVRAALSNPHCALIYHCHNHYMVPVGWQDIPRRRTDMLRANVSQDACDTTLFIADVSRGKHDALYARAWRDVVRDVECVPPSFIDIRRMHLGVQSRARGGSASTAAAATMANDSAAAVAAAGTAMAAPMGDCVAVVPSSPSPRSSGDASAATVAHDARPCCSTAVARPRSVRRNLHCLLCFRNDRIEERLERYEHPSDSNSDGDDSSGDSSSSSSSSSSSDGGDDENKGCSDKASRDRTSAAVQQDGSAAQDGSATAPELP